MQNLRDLLSRIADRDAKRSEATVQADVRTLLLEAPFQLSEDDLREVHLESPAGERRRIDVETGTTVIEVKRDLRRTGVLADAVKQLTGYVEAREAEMKRRYVGVITDGAEWRCFQLTPDGLQEASTFTLRKDKPDSDGLVVWLEGVLATAQQIPPVPKEITLRLGVGSSAHALDTTSLRALYAAHKDHPSVRMKRQLWARLLTTALGSQFPDTDELFVEHTLLVNTAEIIAHAVLGLDPALLPPAILLSGSQFAEHGLHGVVEPDFFDWVVFVPRGETFVRTLARRLSRFDWRAVEHDVLKVLYESVIPAETRKKLGEYYTPDWLAERMVEDTVREPLAERVLDPACGSGTFLFHAVRRYLQAADAAGLPVQEALTGVT
ncbi:MAG: restriction endonuclease, partial [Acidobacteria bacterium]